MPGTLASLGKEMENGSRRYRISCPAKSTNRFQRKIQTIEREYKNALAALQHTSREHQLKKFLETCLIETCKSPRSARPRKPVLGLWE